MSRKTAKLTKHNPTTALCYIRMRVRVVAGGELEDGTRSTGLWIDEWDIQNR